MSQPSVILVHGFWGGAAHWGKVIAELDRRGFRSLHALEIALISLADDAHRAQQMIRQVDGPVLLVGHSYGGAVITEAGDLPNVVGLVYIAAFAPDAGEGTEAITEHMPPAAAASIAADSDGYVWITRDRYHESFCQDLAPDEALVMAVTQKAPAASVFRDTVSTPAWKRKPVWYQVSAQDRIIHPDNQRRMAGRMRPVKTVELTSSHASPASQPTAVADLVHEAANSVT